MLEALTVHTSEREWFPKVRAGLSSEQLQDIGLRLAENEEQGATEANRPPGFEVGY